MGDVPQNYSLFDGAVPFGNALLAFGLLPRVVTLETVPRPIKYNVSARPAASWFGGERKHPQAGASASGVVWRWWLIGGEGGVYVFGIYSS